MDDQGVKMVETRRDDLRGWMLGGFVVLALLAGVELFGPCSRTHDADQETRESSEKESARRSSRVHVKFVPDGDSLVIRNRGQEQRVRLFGIDAPEKGQVMASAAKAFTEQLCLHREVELIEHGKDVYDRLLADVYVDGIHVNKALLREGLAWCFDPRNTDLLQLEQAARAKKIGIWSDPNPIRPAEWRQRQTAFDD